MGLFQTVNGLKLLIGYTKRNPLKLKHCVLFHLKNRKS